MLSQVIYLIFMTEGKYIMKNILNEKQIESIKTLIKHLNKKIKDLNAVRAWYEDTDPQWQMHFYHLQAAFATLIHAIDHHDLSTEDTKACIHHLLWVKARIYPALNLHEKLNIAFCLSLDQIVCDLLIYQSDYELSLAEIKSMNSLLPRHQIYIFSRVEGDETILSSLIQDWVNKKVLSSRDNGFFRHFSWDRTIDVLKHISPLTEPAEYLETVRVSLKNAQKSVFMTASKESTLDYALIYRAINGKKDLSCQKSARTGEVNHGSERNKQFYGLSGNF